MASSLETFCQRVRAGLVQATFAQKRQLIELLIDRVIVTDEQAEIRYVLPTSPRGQQTRFSHLHTDYRDKGQRRKCATTSWPGVDLRRIDSHL